MKAYLNQLTALAEQQQQQARADPVKGFLMQALAAGEFRTTHGATKLWPKEIATWQLQDSYTAATAKKRHKPEFPLAMRHLRKLLPPGSLRKVRRRQGHDRGFYYQLPELNCARAYFAHVTGIELRATS